MFRATKEASQMTKQEIAVALAETHGLTRTLARDVVDGVFDEITNAVRGGDSVNIPKFGVFKPVVRKARSGSSPMAGKWTSPEKKAMRFKVSKTILDELNA